jgi:magnesium transporter
VTWYELDSPSDPQLDQLAEKYSLHPLHIEDCRTEGERVKTEVTPEYTFTLLKTYELAEKGDPALHPICIFAAKDFCITIADRRQPAVSTALARAHQQGPDCYPGRVLYLTFDSVVDSYFPTLDSLDDRIDELSDRVLSGSPAMLENIFAVKRLLVDFRRLLVNTRDASMHLQRDPASIIDARHQMFLRDLYDHVARLLDSVESQRDLLTNALDIYLSSIANRTNEVMKVLTVGSTIALPALVVTGIYGMNVKGLPFLESPHGAELVLATTIGLTVGLLAYLRRLGWI